MGIRLSSFLTSSKGSKTTPVNGRVLAPFEAETTTPPAFLAGESLRIEEEEEEEENRGPKFSGRELATERAAEGARRSMIEGAE